MQETIIKHDRLPSAPTYFLRSYLYEAGGRFAILPAAARQAELHCQPRVGACCVESYARTRICSEEVDHLLATLERRQISSKPWGHASFAEKLTGARNQSTVHRIKLSLHRMSPKKTFRAVHRESHPPAVFVKARPGRITYVHLAFLGEDTMVQLVNNFSCVRLQGFHQPLCCRPFRQGFQCPYRSGCQTMLKLSRALPGCLPLC
mmetsp:Transcript_72360/g.132431  ORF Transcript_72360/g.132431 Transcript_72360/m.132431 type:complete len:205 (-) Transcript_72360:645-1259(-)